VILIQLPDLPKNFREHQQSL